MDFSHIVAVVVQALVTGGAAYVGIKLELRFHKELIHKAESVAKRAHDRIDLHLQNHHTKDCK